jgi:hypothetical protein
MSSKHKQAWKIRQPKGPVDPDEPYQWPKTLKSIFGTYQNRPAIGQKMFSTDTPTPREVARHTDHELLKMPMLGIRKLHYIKAVIEAAGLELAQTRTDSSLRPYIPVDERLN